METTEPIFARPLVLVASDETRSSTSFEQPRARSIPRAIANLIGKVGLRYEPSVKSDLEAHAARVALLAEDMADADPRKLQLAIQQWAASRPYMPKASDLNEAMAAMSAPARHSECVDVVTPANERLAAQGRSLRWAWHNPNDWSAGTYLTNTAEMDNPLARRIAAEDAAG